MTHDGNRSGLRWLFTLKDTTREKRLRGVRSWHKAKSIETLAFVLNSGKLYLTTDARLAAYLVNNRQYLTVRWQAACDSCNFAGGQNRLG